MLTDMRLSFKMALGFGIILVLAAILGGVAVFKMREVTHQASRLQLEYLPEVNTSEGLEKDSLATMYEMRGYGFTEQKEFLEKGRKNLETVKKRLNDAKELAARFPVLVKLREGAEQAEARVNVYEKLVNDTVASFSDVERDRASMELAAQKYMKESNDFLASQARAMETEIRGGKGVEALSERLQKIGLANEIIDLGNWTIIGSFKAQALRNPKMIESLQANFQTMMKKLEELKAITHQEVNLKQIAETGKAAEDYRKALDGLLASWMAVQELGGKRQAAGDEVLAIANTVSTAGMDHMIRITADSVASLSSASVVVLVGLGIMALIGIAIASVTVLGITRPILRVANGLRDGADQVAAASGQVSASSQQLAEGASQQAAAIEETSSSMEEMSSMTKQNADNASQTNHLMSEANAIIHHAQESMLQLTSSMEDISRASEETFKIIKTIDEIAFQTNLLALNAAVEAARAGEAGAGFAVVADEVRNLAMRAADAAKNTAGLIEDTVKKVKDGGVLVEKTNEEFAKVTASASKMGNLVGEITEASQEQSQGIGQINNAVAEMDKVVQQNAANAEESAAAAEEMNAQAEQMKEFVNELLVLVQGRGERNGGLRVSRRKARKHRDLAQLHFSDSMPPYTDMKAGINGNGKGNSRELVAAARSRKLVDSASVIPFDGDDF